MTVLLGVFEFEIAAIDKSGYSLGRINLRLVISKISLTKHFVLSLTINLLFKYIVGYISNKDVV
jgi:hypothetical protein